MEKLKYIIEDSTIAEVLGVQNFTNEESAILELVKNAYDAQSLDVVIIISKSQIIIEDNGIGMNRQKILGAWMHVGISDKKYIIGAGETARVLAGSKGVGRFAIARLGAKASVYTKMDQQEAVLWKTDWNTNTLETYQEIKERGTKIVIEQLRDNWTESRVRNLREFLSRTYNDDKMKIQVEYKEDRKAVTRYFGKIQLGVNCVSVIRLQYLAKFQKEYLAREHKIYGKVLEPSVGDGRFLDAFEKEESIEKIVAVELIEEKVGQLKNRGYLEQVEIVADDFLDFAEKTSEKYQLIIGNPPYINIKNMENNSKEKAKEICEKFQLPNSLMQNMWVAFVLAAVSCLEREGTIFFVLPMEFLQVQYAEKIRLFLEEHFDTIHILSFKERMFPKIEQESCLVYLTNEFKNQPYINFKIYAQLDSDYPYYCSKIQRNKPLKKWTNAILSDEDIDLLNMIDSKYKKVSEVCEASPGIVTGANNEFILTKEQVEQLECHEFVLPTIAKSIIVNGQFILTQDVVEKIGERGNRIYLLNLSHVDEKLLSKSLMEYLTTIGEKQNAAEVKLKDRYKCRNRKPWYGVPIVRNGDLFFFKRYDKIPRICVNETDLYTTDIAYNMRLDSAYDKESMAFCFYNSLTLTQCEFYGRYYAGGVSELTPSEFKRLAIPYRKIDKDDIKQLSEMFKANENIDKIIAFVNLKTIEKDWEHKQILKLDKMRRKLMERRLP